MVERVKTGIEGLDKALNGGIPTRNLVLVSGGAGTGKSTLCMQYLYNGAKMFKEKSLYVSTEQTEEELRKQGDEYGWNLLELEEKGLLRIIFIDIVREDHFLERVKEAMGNFKPKRLVIDSMSTLADYAAVTDYARKGWSVTQIQSDVIPTFFSEALMTKKILVALISELKEYDATILLTSELPEESVYLSADKMSEFITDGVIIIHYLGVGSTVFRSLKIRKMRYTDHEKGSISFEMGKTGIEIKGKEIGL